MLRHDSVATIEAPEFINLTSNAINPGISECEIKVLYLGHNRNHSYIDKQSAIKIAETLPGTPIVGAYHEDIEDFGDHGEVIHIEDGKISFSCATVPYGFVAPNAKAWFKNFEDIDEFGNRVERTYLMTTGYLWTGQYPEIAMCINEGMGQSMELDPENMDGYWATDSAKGIDFFIINDASLTKLCVLGSGVEPCYEGASVTKPEVSATFSTEQFTQTLFTMMNELKDALENKGGSSMDQNQLQDEVEVQEPNTEMAAETIEEAEVVVDGDTQAEDSFAAKDEKKEDKESSDDSEGTEEIDEEEKKKEVEDKNACGDKKKTKSALEDENASLISELEELKASFAALQDEMSALREFKLARVEADKDALIAKYFMLSDEDKAEIIAHKSEFSLDELEAKLALLYVQKNVNFDVDSMEEEETDAPVTSFSLEDTNIVDDGFADDELFNSLRAASLNL